jgi:hypothetical protein
MKLDFKGTKRNTTKIQNLINLLKTSDTQLWEYMGLNIEIDPTIDYNNENILVRWLDIEEGFNDKIIVYSLLEFQSLFKPVNLC